MSPGGSGGTGGIGAWLNTSVDDVRGLTWPRWVPLTCTVCAVAIVVGALAQRGELVPPGRAWLPALLALAPWLLLEATGHNHLPTWGFVACAVGGTYWLLLDGVSSDVAPFLLVLLCLEVGAVSGPWATAATVAACIAPMFVLELSQDVGGWWVWLPGLAAGAIGGFAAQAQVRLLANERASRTVLAEQLAAEQRREVAREVHDVVAHSLAVTMLHLTAARHALEADGDVDEAVDSLREAERIGRQAMGDIRRTVGLLDPAGGDTRPLPGAADLPALVEEFRAAGLDVDAALRGPVGDLPPSVALAVYRVAEEALANVAKHAPGASGHADGRGRRRRRGAPGGEHAAGGRRGRRGRPRPGRPATRRRAGTGAGAASAGMRERVELLGGTLEAGPTGAGWEVAARIPRRPAGVTAGPPGPSRGRSRRGWCWSTTRSWCAPGWPGSCGRGTGSRWWASARTARASRRWSTRAGPTWSSWTCA